MAISPGDPVTYKLNLNSRGLDKVSNKDAALKEIADLIKESILSYVGSTQSPVAGGGTFPHLSPQYKKFKAEQHSSPIANLELTGAMLDGLEYKIDSSAGEIEIGVFAKDEALKADNHNKFSSASHSTPVPKRQFIPKADQKFRSDIEQDIDKIIQSYTEANTEAQGLLANLLGQIFRSSIR